MNTKHALGFLLCGFAMLLMPSVAPDWVQGTGANTTAREAWLLFMGSLKTSLGGGWLLRTGCKEHLRPALAAWTAAQERRAVPRYATWQRVA